MFAKSLGLCTTEEKMICASGEYIDDTEDLINIQLDYRYEGLTTVYILIHVFSMWHAALILTSI